MKKNILYTIAGITIGVFLGFNFIEPKETIVIKEIIKEPEIECDYYVFHENNRLCISEDMANYIESINTGKEDRMKSKRGVLKN